MPKYKRKPSEVDAAQYNNPGDASGVVENGKGGVSFEFAERLDENKKPYKSCTHCERPSREHGYIQKTAHGGQIVCPGSWIVSTGDSVKVYNDDEFKEKFEVV